MKLRIGRWVLSLRRECRLEDYGPITVGLGTQVVLTDRTMPDHYLVERTRTLLEVQPDDGVTVNFLSTGKPLRPFTHA